MGQPSELLRKCLPLFEAAGLVVAGELTDVSSHAQCELWGGMGAILQLRARFSSGTARTIIAKVIDLPAEPRSVSERRKKLSYQVEARFYEQGHAERLIKAGATCPFPLLVDWPVSEGGRLSICMTQLQGREVRNLSRAQAHAALAWLARLHACYWGARAEEAVARGGLHAQGCYWHLDTRLDELERFTDTSGFEGRLRRAARAVDARLKADRHQTIIHGDAKTENMLFAKDGSVSVFDFQYVGRASPGKDLAYSLLGVDRLGDAQLMPLLEHYLGELAPLLTAQGEVPPSVEELRVSYLLGACDLARWMVGWNRSYWSSFRSIMVPRCEPLLRALDDGNILPSEEAYLQAMFSKFPVQ